MDGGARRATVHGVAKSQTQLSNFTFTYMFHKHVHICMLVIEHLEECKKENKNEKII